MYLKMQSVKNTVIRLLSNMLYLLFLFPHLQNGNNSGTYLIKLLFTIEFMQVKSVQQLSLSTNWTHLQCRYDEKYVYF